MVREKFDAGLAVKHLQLLSYAHIVMITVRHGWHLPFFRVDRPPRTPGHREPAVRQRRDAAASDYASRADPSAVRLGFEAGPVERSPVVHCG